jgi:hypothetical protein
MNYETRDLGLNGPVAKAYEKIDYGQVFTNVMYDLERSYPYFADIHARFRRNVNYYAGYQWTSQELYAHQRQFRIPYVWNKIGQQINNILGTQVQTKLDTRANAIEPSDEAAAELLNKLIKWAEQLNDIDKVESDVFKSGLLGGMGATQVKWDYSELYGGYPVVERIPSYQLVWDLNTTQIDFSDTRWMARVIPMTRAEAYETLPEYEEQIQKADRSYAHAYYIMKQAFTPLQSVTFDNIGLSSSARDLIYVIEHYEKIRQLRYIVVDLIGNTEPMVFDSEAEANKYYDGLVTGYIEGGQPIIDEKGKDNVFIAEIKRDCFLQNLLIGNECVASQMTDLAAFPYQVFFANYMDGDFWSYADALISPQRFINRMVSEWDLQIGRANKQFATVIEHKLANGWDFNRFMTARSQTGAAVPVQDHSAIQFHPNQPAHPDIPKVLGMSQSFMMELAGGANAMGMQENAAESSKAVRARQAAAGLAKLPMYENLTRWRKSVTENIVWYLRQFLDDDQIIRIIGPGSKPQFLELDSTDLDTIKAARTDIAISQTVNSDIAREETLAELREFFQAMQGAIPGQVALPILLELSTTIPPDVKEKLMSQLDFYQQWLQQQAAQEKSGKQQQQASEQVNSEYMRDMIRTMMQQQQPNNPVVQKLG